jgi:c-di-GMP-binding flagellar brake protein YcgR
MENRRQHFRHHFPDAPPVPVMLRVGRRALSAHLANLSVTGAGIVCPGATAPQPGERGVLILTEWDEDTELPVETVHHAQATGCLGLRFIASIEPRTQQTREQLVWRILWRAQRAGCAKMEIV